MKKVLVIDDEKDLLFLVKSTLEFEGAYKVMISDNLSAERNIREFQPDIVLLDIMMPGVNGFDILSRIKGSENTSHIPVLMLSALGDDSSKVTSSTLYGNGYLVKPVDKETLVSAIEKCLAI
ncbi:MAG: response regulator transcription factor [Deltaproteobacteria bacterium]